MSTDLTSSSCLRLVLVSTGPAAHLAVGTLSQHLKISETAALGLLGDAPSVLADSVAPETAKRLAGLLRSFGLSVRLDNAVQRDRLVDLAIQLSVPVRMQRTIRLVANETALAEDEVSRALRQPGGIVLSGLTRSEADRYQAALGRLASLSLIESDPASAVYDVFLGSADMTEELADHLRLMGVEADPIVGAVAAGLDKALCDHLRNRFAMPGLVALDRSFQRFDMYLSRATGWVTQDLADFLVARTGLPRSRFEVLSDSLPLRIEFGLGHSAARQFRADYASIGLHTFIVLAGLAENLDNPKL